MAEPEVGGNFWGNLVNSNKTAAPLLEQLCSGLIRVISRLGNGPDDKLTPERMAAFYRSVGGHFDLLFLGPNEAGSSAGTYINSGLSFLYRTLGCYHSLEPTPNAYETPCVPCLTPVGFVRWQTLQLLLYPDEHARYLQKAVEVYDVPRPDGRFFSKTIPRDAFPDKPDVEMEKWYKQISSQLNYQDYVNRLKNSPYSSPNPQPFDRPDGYFGAQIPHIRRPSRGSKDRSSEEDRRRPRLDSRRSSVPSLTPPTSSTPDYTRPPSAYQKRDSSKRSTSAQRLGHRPRAATTDFASHQRNSSSSSQRDDYDRPSQGPQRYPPPYSRHHSSSKYKTPLAEDDASSGEASSEDSANDRRRRKYVSSPRDDFKKRGLLTPALNLFSTKRRHSHDAGAMRKEDRPRRNEGRSTRNAAPESSSRQGQAVRFKDNVFRDDENASESLLRSASSRRSETFPRSSVSSETMYGHPMARDPSSGSGSDRRRGSNGYERGSRSQEFPLRVSTVTGVGGRRYANAEPNSAASGSPDTPQREPRTRYSVAV